MEEHAVSTTTIIINVGVQIANLVIFFLLFKYFLGDKIAAALTDRERLIKKLKHAETEYSKIIETAKQEKDTIISEAIDKQKSIIKEGEIFAHKQTTEILETSKNKSDDIIKNAQLEGEKIKRELERNREESVKSTSKKVVKKLLSSDTNLNDEYLQTLIKEVANS